MLKLYKFTGTQKLYWETWDNTDGTHEVHWGELGTEGESKSIKPSLFNKPTEIIQKEIDVKLAEGYKPIDQDDHIVLLVEYSVNGFGDEKDLDKRHCLESRMNHTLGWAGLGACDGGSIGSGTMEVCNYVVDFKLAKAVIEKDLKNTEYSDYTKIYEENA